MGLQTIVSGRISLKEDFKKSKAILRKLKDDKTYPFITKEMFSLSPKNQPYYYCEPIVAFATDYKNLEYNFQSFILKFENILAQFSFSSAAIIIETELHDDYYIQWRNKECFTPYEDKESYIESDDWFFSCKRIELKDANNKSNKYKTKFKYPVKISDTALGELNNLLSMLETKKSVNVFKTEYTDYEELHLAIIYAINKGVVSYNSGILKRSNNWKNYKSLA